MTTMQGRTAVVTGASSGIGRATANRLAQAGANVALMALGDEHLDETREEVAAHGAHVRSYPVDVSKSEEVIGAFEAASELGAIDAVFNNAGISVIGPITDFSDSDWNRLVQTNLSGNFFVNRQAARLMIAGDGGAIVNTASELAPHKIRVNAVCPGSTMTPQFQAELDRSPDPTRELADNEETIALRRIGQPHEIANVVEFLLSDRASYVTGTHFIVDGGRTGCFPSLRPITD